VREAATQSRSETFGGGGGKGHVFWGEGGGNNIMFEREARKLATRDKYFAKGRHRRKGGVVGNWFVGNEKTAGRG